MHTPRASAISPKACASRSSTSRRRAGSRRAYASAWRSCASSTRRRRRMTSGLKRVEDESAWKGADFRGDTSWIYTLDRQDVAELASAAQACLERGLGITAIGREDFPLQTLAPKIGAWAQEINQGRG